MASTNMPLASDVGGIPASGVSARHDTGHMNVHNSNGMDKERCLLCRKSFTPDAPPVPVYAWTDSLPGNDGLIGYVHERCFEAATSTSPTPTAPMG